MNTRDFRQGLRVMLVVMAVQGCGRQPAAQPSGDEQPTIAVTRWSDRTELFMEYPPLVAGETARFAVHLTDLETFQPVRSGRVVVRLAADQQQAFVAEGPSSPGIFGVDVVPPAPGTYELAVGLESDRLRDVHQVGSVTVFDSAAAAIASTPADEEHAGIAFLKEQQWNLDFATALAAERALRVSLTVPAEIRPRAGGEVEVAAPIAGRIAAGQARPVGARVMRGEVLAELVPQSAHMDDRPALETAIAEARAVHRLARAELARVRRLVSEGAVPTRRLAEAETAEETAAIRVKAAEEHLAQLDLTRRGEGGGTPETRVTIRAPIGGIVAGSHLTLGAGVEEGQRLFRLVDVDRVYVVGAVPESELARLVDMERGELEAPGHDRPVSLARPISVGRVVDHETRTVPVTFELRSPDRRLAVGQAVTLRLFRSADSVGITVPEAALVDDAGQPVVFVQTGGEIFGRRPVRLGSRGEGHVQILAGVELGERVVTKGAALIRLAALSPQVPAHGHVH